MATGTPILGPVPTGTTFMITSVRDGAPYVLLQSMGAYYWEGDLGTIQNSTTMGLFSATGTVEALTLTDSINGGGIGVRDGVVINVIEPAVVSLAQSQFANWNPPDLLLASVEYTLATGPGPLSIYTSPVTGGTGGVTGIPPTTPATNLQILPIYWYFNCNSSSYDSISQPLDSVTNWFCVTNPATTGCSGVNLAEFGWTNLDDCNAGKVYSYCPVNQTCGQLNCNGPCPAIYDDCTFESPSFVCVLDPEKYFTETDWWTSPWFIGIIVAIVFLIVIVIILLFAVFRRRK